MVKSLVRANFWPYVTCRIRTRSQNVISGSNFVKIWPLRAGSSFSKFQKCRYILVYRVKSLTHDNFWPNRTCRIRTGSQNVISGSNFVKIWPLTSTRNVNFAQFNKFMYRLVCRVKSLVRDHFYPHQTYWIRTISQNVISERNFVKFWPLTSPREVNYAKFQKRRYRFVFRAKLLGCANFWPNQRDGFRVIPKPNWIL